MPHAKAPTLKTIAAMTGLSLSTVSLSLRDGARLKPETREKVARAAAEIGYVPNRAGVRLRTGQTHVLTMILSIESNTLDYTRQLIQGIGARLLGSPYHLNVSPEPPGRDPIETLEYILANKTSDGVILTHTSTHDPRVERLTQAGLPFVTHGRTAFGIDHAFVDFHVEGFIDQAIERLLAKDRRRFVYVPFDNGTTNFKYTVDRFDHTIQSKGLVGDVILNAQSIHTAASARQFARDIAHTDTPPDALICTNEVTAIALLEGMQDSGKRCGDDFDLVCKSTTELLPALFPQIDTATEDLYDAGQQLAEQLLLRLKGEPVSNTQSLQEPKLNW